ncbi:MAG TPA: T9SS type A sorting domain-containing protein, partial [Chitinophagales bacterium]|nr:T9SS type A sorting domain-containing protein [Chitinophagales bacterium]
MLTAANVPSWLVGDGSVGVMAYNANQRYSPYSHSQVYTQNSTPDTFYTTVRNVVNAAGSGIASVYGNLSAEFFPSSGIASLSARGIEKNDIQARGEAVAFDSITIDAPTDGYALAQLDGYCTSSVGDELLFAVNNVPQWEVNEGHITVSAAYSNNNFSTLSHSRLFPVTAGSHKFYCVTENKGQLAGNGLVDIAATFTVKFYPNVNVGINRIENAPVFRLFPNPASNTITILLNNNHNQRIDITDISGRLIETRETGNQTQLEVNIAHLTAGIYFVKSGNYTLKLVKQ